MSIKNIGTKTKSEYRSDMDGVQVMCACGHEDPIFLTFSHGYDDGTCPHCKTVYHITTEMSAYVYANNIFDGQVY